MDSEIVGQLLERTNVSWFANKNESKTPLTHSPDKERKTKGCYFLRIMELAHDLAVSCGVYG